MSPAQRTALSALARAWGLQTTYTDAGGRRRTAPRESVLAVLALLGAPVERSADAPGALRQWSVDRWRRVTQPVTVAWTDRAGSLTLRLPAEGLPPWIGCCVELEDGDLLQQRHRTRELSRVAEATLDGERFVELALPLGPRLPDGYHRITVDSGRLTGESTLIAAPPTAHEPTPCGKRSWGLFLPLYALHGKRSWGAGSYADLTRLVDWMAERGGTELATLPLYPSFLEGPFDPSPYLPVSRLMWNELYVAVEELPALKRRLDRLRRADEVDHRRQLALQRPVMERLARDLESHPSAERTAFRNFLRRQPRVAEYARFRAAGDRQGRPWPAWPARLRDGLLRPSDYSRAAERYHAYSQWRAARQIDEVASRAAERGVRLQLDLPLGTHPTGFDVWREPTLFARGAAAGAPPDAFFPRGQTWCFPPLHPERSRRQAHRYFADCLRHVMATAGLLRLDHVMSLHRLFWIPDGRPAAEGLYVRYPAEELYAVLCLESRRHRCALVGEDLGTVPREVRPAMRRHGLRRSFVLQYARGSNPRRPLSSLKIDGVASLHTHDMPPFAAFWRGLDAGLRARLGHLSTAAAGRERAARLRLRAAWQRELRRGGWLASPEPTTLEALEACLAFLADSAAETLLVDLEDLWGETRPQNVPGTTSEWPNWRRRARYALEQLDSLPRLARTLRRVDTCRSRNRRRR